MNKTFKAGTKVRVRYSASYMGGIAANELRVEGVVLPKGAGYTGATYLDGLLIIRVTKVGESFGGWNVGKVAAIITADKDNRIVALRKKIKKA